MLGDVDPSVVVAGFGFLSPQAAETLWPAVLHIGPARQASAFYVNACEAYGRTMLAELSETETARLAELAERVIDSADVTGLARFAGWKAADRPTPAGPGHVRAAPAARVAGQPLRRGPSS